MRLSPPTQADLEAVILAGGQGRRVGYQQKALLCYQGHTVLSQVMQQLSLQVSQIYINANQQRERYLQHSDNVFSDQQTQFLGPLAGMLAAFKTVNKEWLLFVPCDNPTLPKNLVRTLIKAYQQTPAPIIVAHDGQRMQPLYVMMHQSMQPALEMAIENGHLSVMRWIKAQSFHCANFSDLGPEAFKNLNTRQDLD